MLRELSWRKCKGENERDLDALIFFARNYVKIQHPERGAILFDLRPAQVEILEVWLQERYSIVLKSRQIGWSTLLAVYSLWLALFYPDRVIVLLSKGEREAVQLLSKAVYAYDRLPAWMRERGPKRTSRNQKRLSFANASSIDSLPSKEDPARGTAVTLVGVDEWAFLDNPEDAWASIEPIADVGGRIIGLSTANGSGNFFHEFWIKAVTGVSSFKPMFYPWTANTDRDSEWYDARARNMQEWQLHQEYPSTAEEAFIKSGNPVFDVDALGSIEPVKPVRGDLILDGDGGLRGARFEPNIEGPLSVYSYPTAGDEYVLGVDVAEGLEHGDFSSVHVVSIKTDRVVAHWHGHVPADVLGEIVAALGWWYRSAFVGAEVNNHGLSTCHTLQRLQYPRLYYRRSLDQRTKKMLSQIGWFTSRVSKPLMIDELARALREGFVIEDEHTIGELRTYVRDERGQMHGSPFDDRVMSLAIANQMREFVSVREAPVVENNYGTFNYYLDKVRPKPDAVFVMGRHNVRDVA